MKRPWAAPNFVVNSGAISGYDHPCGGCSHCAAVRAYGCVLRRIVRDTKPDGVIDGDRP